MASLRLLLLLLVSSSLLHLSHSVKHETQKNAKKVAKTVIPFVKDTAIPLLRLIPKYGPEIAAVANVFLALAGIPIDPNADVKNKLKSEFESLNTKLDKYHVEQKWATWASGAYQQLEVKINNAWRNYEDYEKLHSAEGDANKKQELRDKMIRACAESWDDTETLHSYLTAGPVSFMNNLGLALAESLNCHEKEFGLYTFFIYDLLARGILLSRKCFKLQGINIPDQKDREAKVLYNALSALHNVQRYCVFNSDEYIKKDVENLVGDPDISKQDLADQIRLYLAEVYSRYDWMVVVFQTDRSNHKIRKVFNKHTVDGFLKVERGEFTVAVAPQVKGKHSEAQEVEKAIGKCGLEKLDCHEVPQKLSECLKDSKPYTAVHAFKKEPRQSYEGNNNEKNQENQEDDFGVDVSPENEALSHYHEGKCKKYYIFRGGKFVVMIKSDEERMNKDPCFNTDCGGAERGTCVYTDGVFIPMCECKEPFFGRNCEYNVNDFIRHPLPEDNNRGSNGGPSQAGGNNKPTVKDSRVRKRQTK